MADKWKNRIVGEGSESPAGLLANPANFRKHPKHQQQALSGSLDAIGWVQRVIVNQTTGHIVDGHLRVELARQAGEASIPVVYVALTEDEERKALLSLDPIAALAETNREEMGKLLLAVSKQGQKMPAYLHDVMVFNEIDIDALIQGNSDKVNAEKIKTCPRCGSSEVA